MAKARRHRAARRAHQRLQAAEAAVEAREDLAGGEELPDAQEREDLGAGRRGGGVGADVNGVQTGNAQNIPLGNDPKQKIKHSP